MSAELNFVRQQGFSEASPATYAHQYTALMLQPRAIGVLVVVGLAVQSWPYFIALAALLWWNVALPGLNPYDAAYNSLVARPRSLPRPGPAPGPRRLAQAMAGTFMLAIGLALRSGLHGLAVGLEGLLVAALAALIFGKFCLGSYVFHLLAGRGSFANRTVPWARGARSQGVAEEVPGAPERGTKADEVG